MTDLLYQAETPVIAAVAHALRTAITIGAVALRVDERAAQGPIAAPMAIVTWAGGPTFYGLPMGGDELAHVPLLVLFVGESLDQAVQLRGRGYRELLGRDTRGKFWSPLTVTGFVVTDREYDATLPPPVEAGVLSQAVLPLTVSVERAS